MKPITSPGCSCPTGTTVPKSFHLSTQKKPVSDAVAPIGGLMPKCAMTAPTKSPHQGIELYAVAQYALSTLSSGKALAICCANVTTSGPSTYLPRHESANAMICAP